MHYEMKPYTLSSSSHHRATNQVVMKRESEAIHVGCVTEGMDNDRVGYNATTAQCGIQVCHKFKMLHQVAMIAPMIYCTAENLLRLKIMFFKSCLTNCSLVNVILISDGYFQNFLQNFLLKFAAVRYNNPDAFCSSWLLAVSLCSVHDLAQVVVQEHPKEDPTCTFKLIQIIII